MGFELTTERLVVRHSNNCATPSHSWHLT